MSDGLDLRAGQRTADRHQDREKLIRQAYEVGPETVLFIEKLWHKATQEALWSSLEVFQLVRWYSAQRLERVLARAAARGIEGIDGLRLILEENLDLSEGWENAGPHHQLLLPLSLPQDPEILPQSGKDHGNAGIPITGSRK